MSQNFFNNKYLHQIFSYKILTVGNPLTTTQFYSPLVYSLNDRGLFIKGGMHSFVDNIKKNFLNKGGLIKTNSEVDKIFTDDKQITGVEAHKGEKINVDIIISGVDPKLTAKLLGRELPICDKYLRKRYSHSFLLYISPLMLNIQKLPTKIIFSLTHISIS